MRAKTARPFAFTAGFETSAIVSSEFEKRARAPKGDQLLAHSYAEDLRSPVFNHP